MANRLQTNRSNIRTLNEDVNKLQMKKKDLRNTKDTTKDIMADKDYLDDIERFWKGVVELPKNWENMTVRERRDWSYLQINQHMKNVPKRLAFLVVGWFVKGDGDASIPTPKPHWLDDEKFMRGQRFAMNHAASMSFGEIVSVFDVYSFYDSFKPVIITNNSNTPFTSFKRYQSTVKRLFNWYISDPWMKGTPACNDMQIVRNMHALIRNKMINTSYEEIDRTSKIEKTWSPTLSALLEDFRNACPMAAPGQCPYMFREGEQYMRSKGVSQAEVAMIQSTFINLVILYPEYLGIHDATDEDLNDYCHLWRGLGHCLGLEDEFNFCSGTLEEVKQRSRDLLEYWVKPNLRDVSPEWEHILRCFTTGLRYILPAVNYAHVLLYHAEILNIRMPRLEATLSYGNWLSYKFLKLFVFWIARIPLIITVANRVVVYCLESSYEHSRDELEELKKLSAIQMSNGIAETLAAEQKFSNATYWHKNLLLILLLTCILLSLAFIAKALAMIF